MNRLIYVVCLCIWASIRRPARRQPQSLRTAACSEGALLGMQRTSAASKCMLTHFPQKPSPTCFNPAVRAHMRDGFTLLLALRCRIGFIQHHYGIGMVLNQYFTQLLYGSVSTRLLHQYIGVYQIYIGLYINGQLDDGVQHPFHSRGLSLLCR